MDENEIAARIKPFLEKLANNEIISCSVVWVENNTASGGIVATTLGGANLQTALFLVGLMERTRHDILNTVTSTPPPGQNVN